MWSVLNILELILFFPDIDSWRLFSLRVPNTPPRVLSKYATFLNFNLFLFVLEKYFLSFLPTVFCFTALPLFPCYFPVPAFRDVIDVPLVVRRLHKSRKEVRQQHFIDLILVGKIIQITSIAPFWSGEERTWDCWRCECCYTQFWWTGLAVLPFDSFHDFVFLLSGFMFNVFYILRNDYFGVLKISNPHL